MRCSTLTPKQTRQLTLIAEGLSDKEVARALRVTTKTIRNRNQDLYALLGVRNRTEAAVTALRLRLIYPNMSLPADQPPR